MKNETILVVGASGTVGSNIVKGLKELGYNVKSTTSKPVTSSEKNKVHLNLATGEGIKHAFENVDRAFLLSPPGYADQYALLSPLIQEAKRKGLKKVVLMTAMGANANPEAPFRKAEIELEKSGLSYNIIRPNWFYQNFNSFWIEGINQHSKILLPVGTAKVGFIDARDIAAVAVKLLTTDNLSNMDFDITGSEAVDHDEVAAAISEGTGRKITYKEIPSDDLKVALRAAGLPHDYTEFLLLILSYLKQGNSASINNNVEVILGRKPYGLKDYVKEYKSSWI